LVTWPNSQTPSYSDVLIPVLLHGAVASGIDKSDLCHFHLDGTCRCGQRCTYVQNWAERSQSQDFAISVENPDRHLSLHCVKVRSVPKEFLQLGHHHQLWACTQAPLCQLPSPGSGYGLRETPDLWSAPIQGITVSESSQLSFISQLRYSHPVSLLHL